ncbi:unnamed protein product [Brassicogethes aeneus]|uniref:Uncharacterized protein n=1 Tax=Brassicogethes aeneus TaxID=1431903 RepID=A0A9P0B1Z4_BRAAE|nr:unnamed protein product [Brassicogethes aeneus]
MFTYLLLCALVGGGLGLKLPHYLVPCTRGDYPCMTSIAQKTLNGIIGGERKYDIPPLNPLILPLVEIFGPAINISLTDLVIDGIQIGQIQSAYINTEKQDGEVIIKFKKAHFVGNYDINGRILIFSLQGADKANITVENVIVTWKFNYKLFEKNGAKYANITKDVVDFRLDSAIIQLDEIIRGDPEMTKFTNQMLTRDWEIVIEELSIGIKEIISSVYKRVGNGFFLNFPIDVLLKP